MIEKRFRIPNIRNLQSGFESIAKLSEVTRELQSASIILDFNDCYFFEANMVAPLFAVVAKLHNKSNTISVVNLRPKIEEILRKNDFLQHFGFENLRDTYQTTIPFKIFEPNAGKLFNFYLSSNLVGKGIPAMSSGLSKRFRQNVWEIFLNSAIHSQSEQGIFTCGQFFPHIQKLDFTIVDAGIGIPESVRRFKRQRYKNHIDARSAIKWALTKGNTTNTGNNPGGLGLHLIKQFIQMNEGKIQIVSSSGYYEFNENGDSFKIMSHAFPGTCVNIEVNTSDAKKYLLSSERST